MNCLVAELPRMFQFAVGLSYFRCDRVMLP